ncbi:3-hydroxybenzoate 6-monooxygenase, partial [Acinetobacter baumannii]
MLGDAGPPAYRGRTAWRAMLPRALVPKGISDRRLGLWLGPGAHLVHYPGRGGEALNLVAVVADAARHAGWSGGGDRMAL